MRTERFLVDNHRGWRLGLTRFRDETTELRGRPAIVVPGYGMNSFIFRFHPSGPSLVECLAARGLEVWTVDLRGQGRSIRAARGNNRYGLGDLAVDDVGAAIAHVMKTTATNAETVDLVGCSLGTALAFGHVAIVPAAPVHAIVALAGLVTWQDAHPIVKLAYGSPKLAGIVRFTNTRRLARFALPLATKVAPGLLSVYLNERSTDLSQVARLVQTVEDPHPLINREIAEWIRRGDLVMRGVNVSARLPELTHPFLCVVANQDGIVLPVTARHTFDRIGSKHKEILFVGDDEMPVAHADLFLFKGAEERVFAPVADFLLSA
ncbi:MAG: alpha/beta fold hydrolase [Labilithrix sp.]|nr:alpha/beta fold hydrolase [Labilithrix sp.]MCW5816269.1 alpha/beta fold hydrolase [Labilithrix sp.]